MLLGLNGATTMRADLSTDIRVAGQAGYDALEIWAAKLDDFLLEGSLADVVSLLRGAGIKPHAINSIERITFRDEAGYEEVKERCRQLSRVAQVLGCPNIVVVPSDKPAGVTKEEVYQESVRILRDLAEIAAGYGVRLAFEFLGFVACSVNTLADCWEIVQRVDRENVGLVIDAFHFYVGGSRLESIGQIAPQKLFIFHINDAEDLPKAQLTDAHRLLPGEGVIPLKGIIAALRGIGYDGVCSVELFRPKYWEWEPLELAKLAKRKTEELLK